jgi:hypothetical protein
LPLEDGAEVGGRTMVVGCVAHGGGVASLVGGGASLVGGVASVVGGGACVAHGVGGASFIRGGASLVGGVASVAVVFVGSVCCASSSAWPGSSMSLSNLCIIKIKIFKMIYCVSLKYVIKSRIKH